MFLRISYTVEHLQKAVSWFYVIQIAKFILKLSAFRSNFTLSVSVLHFCASRHFSEIQGCTVTVKYKQYVIEYSIVSSEELVFINNVYNVLRGGSRTATSKMELSVIIVNDWKPLIIITKSSNLDAAAVLDPSLILKSALSKLVWDLLLSRDFLLTIVSNRCFTGMFHNVFNPLLPGGNKKVTHT